MRYFVVSAVLILALVVAAPALAAVTAATISTPNTAYVGSCPVTITFTGSITASPGTTYKYGFIRFINGVQQPNLGPGGTGNGSIAVNNDTMTFTSSSVSSADQIYVYKISNNQVNQADFNSNRLYFSVTCSTPTPAPTHTPLHIRIVHPINNLHKTGDAQECGSHGLGFACPGAMANSWLVLVWCWPGVNSCGPTSTSQAIKGFNVYEVDNGKHQLVDAVKPYNDGTLATGGIVETPAGGFANQCYAVSYIRNDGYETKPSQALCLGNGTVGNVTTTYNATASTMRGQSTQYGGVPFRAQGDCDGPLCLGWKHDQSSIIAPSVVPIWWYADNNRVYYRFDLSAIKGHYITSATLNVPIPITEDLSCFSAIAAADTDWNSNNGFIGGDFSTPGGFIGSGLDVKSIVQSWVSGAPNYGFVLRASNENNVAESSTCVITLGTDATLVVVHS
jgi:hypothetical protein